MNNQMPGYGLDASDHGSPAVLLTTLRRLFTLPESNMLRCRFRYSVDDPFAVSVDLLLHTGVSVTWVVSRDLLDTGTTRPTGEGDI
ncbi:SsgA family sporulation/cell division regulator, partial [Streptomyces sp. TRM76130]|nr:SsgA family sporulation/cell division regulator [Streptomyces sp. TRM76130]